MSGRRTRSQAPPERAGLVSSSVPACPRRPSPGKQHASRPADPPSVISRAGCGCSSRPSRHQRRPGSAARLADGRRGGVPLEAATWDVSCSSSVRGRRRGSTGPAPNSAFDNRLASSPAELRRGVPRVASTRYCRWRRGARQPREQCSAADAQIPPAALTRSLQSLVRQPNLGLAQPPRASSEVLNRVTREIPADALPVRQCPADGASEGVAISLAGSRSDAHPVRGRHRGSVGG